MGDELLQNIFKNETDEPEFPEGFEVPQTAEETVEGIQPVRNQNVIERFLKEALTEKAAEREYGLPIGTLTKCRKQGFGGPAYYRINRRYLYARADVESWLAEWLEQAKYTPPPAPGTDDTSGVPF